MIDVLTVVYDNYALLDLQLAHWPRLAGAHRLLVADATPAPRRRAHPGVDWVLDLGGIDGETHGAALDFLVGKAQTDVVGTVDTDFFWLKPDVVPWAEALTAGPDGVACAGCAGFYRDFQANIDAHHPERAGHLAPVCWGMFVRREWAVRHTFVCTAAEARAYHEVGWRLRRALLAAAAPVFVYGGWEHPDDPDVCYFGQRHAPAGIHFLKGSGARASLTGRLPALLAEGVARWA